MKKLAKISALLLAIVIIAAGCKKLPEFHDGSSGGGNNPSSGGTLIYHLNEDPVIGPEFISISAKYSSEHDITEMQLAVSMKADMPEGYTFYSELQMEYPELSGTLTGLEPNTHYFWCILYTELGGKYMTEPIEFITLNE